MSLENNDIGLSLSPVAWVTSLTKWSVYHNTNQVGKGVTGEGNQLCKVVIGRKSPELCVCEVKL